MNPPTEQAASANEFKDRKTGLVIFGILTMLMGGLCALMVPLMIIGLAMSATGAPQNTRAIIPAILVYGVLAAVLVWLGIGSMMARRWARALLLVFSWAWLVIGVVGMSVTAFVLPGIMETINSETPPGSAELPAAARSLMTVISMLVLGVIYVILPGAWVLFYRSRHVKATCEARDPRVRWTDRCPLPVMAVSLWLAFSAPTMMVVAVAYNGVLPVFGTFITGPIGSAVYVLLGLLWGYSAWALYKLDRRGWWIIVASIVIFSISGFLTYLRHDVMELYSLMGYPEEQIAQIQKFNFLKGSTMAWASICGALPLLGFLLYLRRFFPNSRMLAK